MLEAYKHKEKLAYKPKDCGGSLWSDGWIRLKKNKLAIVSSFILGFLCITAVLTPIIAPYGYEEQNLLLGAAPPSASHWLGTDAVSYTHLTLPTTD